ncbi:MAG: Cys-tRNA(Pro) deacylase [Atribacterota bacterium]|nr:Cys-tRNA(Pro) deacylase [Atribacterota bacterium]
MKKTNAMRLLDKLNIDYEVIEYKVNPDDLSAEHVSQDTGIPLDRIFKTLVAYGENTGDIIACIPGNTELNLKKLAQVSNNKKVFLIPVREINKKTGYIRGGVSPLALKHPYPHFIDQSALRHDFILVSAGQRGLQIKINPGDLIDICQMKVETLTI